VVAVDELEPAEVEPVELEPVEEAVGVVEDDVAVLLDADAFFVAADVVAGVALGEDNEAGTALTEAPLVVVTPDVAFVEVVEPVVEKGPASSSVRTPPPRTAATPAAVVATRTRLRARLRISTASSRAALLSIETTSPPALSGR
jgi:hypothetical protein